MIPSKSSLFNKKGTYLLDWLKNKNRIPTFWVKNKNFSQNFVFVYEKLVSWCPDPGSGSGLGKKIQDPDPYKTNPGPKHWVEYLVQNYNQFCCVPTTYPQQKRALPNVLISCSIEYSRNKRIRIWKTLKMHIMEIRIYN